MINIHLLVEEDYIEELMMALPKDKVKIVEKNFEENKILLQSTFSQYNEKESCLISYEESIKNLDNWLEEKKF